METPDLQNRFDHALISANLDKARREIEKLSNGRSVKLLAVTKTVPAEIINYAIDELGITAIGENRVQELLSKYELLHKPKNGSLEIHLIGSLQTNKVKYIIDKVDMIESVDSLKLACEINKQAGKHSIVMDILAEVNIGREEQKGGVMPEELDEFIKALGDLPSLRLRGLMTVAPRCTDPEDQRKYFEQTKAHFDNIRENLLKDGEREHFDVLSMGMSGSYREAIAAGSNEVRLGSTIFGARQ